MKWILSNIWTRLFHGLAVAALLAPVAMAQTVTLKVAHDSPTSHPYHEAATAFKKQVEHHTEGRVKVDIYPAAALGSEAELISGLQFGAVDVAFTSSGPLTEINREMELFSLPFLFRDAADALRVANGDIGADLSKSLSPAIGARIVAWGSLGERNIWNSRRPVKTLADLKGLKIRVQQSAVQQDTFAALGALPTPMPYGELYTSLQTGVVDGADNGPVDVVGDKFTEVTRYMTMTRHFQVLVPVMISERAISRISEADRQLVLDALAASAKVVTQATERQTVEAMAAIRAAGIGVSELSAQDRDAFVQAVQPVYDKNAARVGGRERIERILQAGDGK